MNEATSQTPRSRELQALALGTIMLAVFAALMGVMTQSPDAHAMTLAFLDQYIAAVPWTAALMVTPLLIIVALAALRHPASIVYVLAVLLPLNLVGRGGDSRILAFGKVLVNVLYLLALVSVAVAPREWRRWLGGSAVGWWLCAFCGCLAFAAIQGYFAGYDLYEWMRELGWLAFYGFAIPVGIFVRTRRELRIVMGLLLVGALLNEGLSLLLLATAPRFERAEDWLGGGTFIRAPFSEGMRFVYLWAVASLFVLWPARRLGTGATLSLATLIVLFSIGLLGSLARSLWLTTLLALSVVVALAPRERRTGMLVLLSLAGAGLAVAGIQFLDKLSPFSSGQWLSDALAFAGALFRGESVSSTVGRQVEWGNAIQLWLGSPFIGNGIGAPFQQTIYSPAGLAAFFTHNSYLNILAKTGLVGFAALAAMVVNVFRLLHRVRHAVGSSLADRVMAITITAYLTGVLVHAFGAATITTTDSVMLFSLVIGLSVVVGRLAGVAPATATLQLWLVERELPQR